MSLSKEFLFFFHKYKTVSDITSNNFQKAVEKAYYEFLFYLKFSVYTIFFCVWKLFRNTFVNQVNYNKIEQ